MVSRPQDNPTPSTVRRMEAEQDVIHQMQSELLALVRVAADEATEMQKVPLRLGDWSSTLESEIYRSLW